MPQSPAGPDDDRLWEALRALRKRLAEEQGVPPYVIFHDAVLMEMVQQRPQSLRELGRLSGIGERKLERYGAVFLAEIQNHGAPPAPKPALTGTVQESLDLFCRGVPVAQIAEQRELKTSTVYEHLAVAIALGLVEAAAVVGLDPDESDDIRKVWLALPDEERGGLKPLYEAFEGRYEYGLLRCLRAGWERR